jgi:hypothetical protein
LDNLVIITVAVFLIALAQGLTILLTIRRERDLKELAGLVDEQRLYMVELTAWLAGRNAAQPRRLKSEREPGRGQIAERTRAPEPATKTQNLPEATPSRTAEDEATQAIKVRNWQRQILAGLRAGLKEGAMPEPTRAAEQGTTSREPPDATGPDAPEDEPEGANKAVKWFKDDPSEPREIAAAREIVARLNAATTPPEPAITPKDLPDATQPTTAEDELERATKAINWLKEDADKAREIIASTTQPAKKTG